MSTSDLLWMLIILFARNMEIVTTSPLFTIANVSMTAKILS